MYFSGDILPGCTGLMCRAVLWWKGDFNFLLVLLPPIGPFETGSL